MRDSLSWNYASKRVSSIETMNQRRFPITITLIWLRMLPFHLPSETETHYTWIKTWFNLHTFVNMSCAQKKNNLNAFHQSIQLTCNIVVRDTVSAMKAEGTYYESCVNTPADQMLKTLKAFRSQRMSNFIFSHININSFRHKCAFMHELLLNNAVDYLAI